MEGLEDEEDRSSHASSGQLGGARKPVIRMASWTRT
jgi:hypothetical protein